MYQANTAPMDGGMGAGGFGGGPGGGGDMGGGDSGFRVGDLVNMGGGSRRGVKKRKRASGKVTVNVHVTVKDDD